MPAYSIKELWTDRLKIKKTIEFNKISKQTIFNKKYIITCSHKNQVKDLHKVLRVILSRGLIPSYVEYDEDMISLFQKATVIIESTKSIKLDLECLVSAIFDASITEEEESSIEVLVGIGSAECISFATVKYPPLDIDITICSYGKTLVGDKLLYVTCMFLGNKVPQQSNSYYIGRLCVSDINKQNIIVPSITDQLTIFNLPDNVEINYNNKNDFSISYNNKIFYFGDSKPLSKILPPNGSFSKVNVIIGSKPYILLKTTSWALNKKQQEFINKNSV